MATPLSFFEIAPCSRCEQLILGNEIRNFWPLKATKMGSWGLEKWTRWVEMPLYFFRFFIASYNDLGLGCNLGVLREKPTFHLRKLILKTYSLPKNIRNSLSIVE